MVFRQNKVSVYVQILLMLATSIWYIFIYGRLNKTHKKKSWLPTVIALQ
jgi:hypothetical protein